jgi:hypothetical protein
VQIFPLLALSVAGVPCAVLGAILKGLTKILFGSKKCPQWFRLPAGKNTHEHMGRIVPDSESGNPRTTSFTSPSSTDDPVSANDCCPAANSEIHAGLPR